MYAIRSYYGAGGRENLGALIKGIGDAKLTETLAHGNLSPNPATAPPANSARAAARRSAAWTVTASVERVRPRAVVRSSSYNFV